MASLGLSLATWTHSNWVANISDFKLCSLFYGQNAVWGNFLAKWITHFITILSNVTGLILSQSLTSHIFSIPNDDRWWSHKSSGTWHFLAGGFSFQPLSNRPRNAPATAAELAHSLPSSMCDKSQALTLLAPHLHTGWLQRGSVQLNFNWHHRVFNRVVRTC